MKSVLAIALIFLLLGMEEVQAKNGYPVNGHRCKIGCSSLGESDYCKKICKEKAGSSYGYCYAWACYCENVGKNAVLWKDPTLGPCIPEGK
ncbi:alpha-toxin Cn12-like [Centruroides sculpturatus]|uniref:alpha-toxin Cn12-like n=1 Tax=Centruroides sculpturatus TaxID=218467 RepID=UPI000C6C93E3|nr:alpha-toxin Cn12-like [Centruroides sculpturatus]